MNKIKFEWDKRKSAINKNKHGITFDEAKSVFYDDHARLIRDPDHSSLEERFILLGISSSSKLLIVCHCYRENENTIRIISARKATKKESKQYREF